MQRDPRAFLWNVREAASAIQSFPAGMEAAAFATNEMAQSAVERKFEIIGYATVNVSTVWNVAQNALPPLISAVQTLMDELGDT